MQDIEDLPSLRDCRKKRVVASLPLLLVVADRCSLGSPALGADHGTVEVDRHPTRRAGLDALDHGRADQLPHVRHDALVHLRQPTRQRRHVGDPVQAKKPLEQRVVAVVVEIAEAAPPEERMRDQDQQHRARAVACRVRQVPHAILQQLPKL